MTEPAACDHLLLFVDDEPPVLEALKRSFFDEPFEILTATSGQDGLEIVERQAVSLVLSDLRMPGMSGTEFLAAVKKVKPDVVTMMLTGVADLDAAKKAINEAGVHRFLTKPWDDQELADSVRLALKQLDLERENRRLLQLTQEQNQQLQELNSSLEARVEDRTRKLAEANLELEQSFKGSARMFTDLTETFDPELGAHSKRVADLCAAVGGVMGLPHAEIEEIEIAGLLHDIGLIAIPRDLLRLRTDSTSEVSQLIKRHPRLGADILSGISRFNQIAALIHAHHETLDGSGYPEGRRELSQSMRILSAVENFDEVARPPGHAGAPATERAMARIRSRRFDPDVAEALTECIEQQKIGSGTREVGVEVRDLRPGMVLTRKLDSTSGQLILSEGARFTAATLQRLKSLKALGKIPGHVYVLAEEDL